MKGVTMTDMTTTQAHNRYALSMPAHNGEAVTQAHTDYCEANSHADLNGTALHCHRCGTGTTNLTPARVTTLTRDYSGRVNGYYVTEEATGAHVGDDYARDLTEALTGATHHDTDRN